MSDEQYRVELNVVRQNHEPRLHGYYEFGPSSDDEARLIARQWVEEQCQDIPREVGLKGTWVLTKDYRRVGVDGGTIDLSPKR